MQEQVFYPVLNIDIKPQKAGSVPVFGSCLKIVNNFVGPGRQI